MNNFRIELTTLPVWRDARGEAVVSQAENVCGIRLDSVWTRDVYTLVSDCTEAEAVKIASLLCNPVLQMWRTGSAKSDNFVPAKPCDYVISVGFRPGVTDNVSRTFRTAAADIIGRKLRDDEYVFSSTEYMLCGKDLDEAKVNSIGQKILANELIQSVTVVAGADAENVPANLPFVNSDAKVEVRTYDLEVSDEKLMEVSKKGILALSLEEMKAIQNYFRTATGREEYGLTSTPTDVELEILAQTWSEHCKHKIFSAEIDYTDTETGEKAHINSCYKSYIQKSTKEIAEKVPWLVSVFKDNAGVIDFNDKCDIAYKVETHNSPSALDPYGGAMTGIVGVNRDPMGTGQGAELLINVWGYCLGSPFTADENVPEGLLHPRRLRDGVHKGVIDGGNQSGIPYGNGWEYFDDRYIGKPLVYCGTVGKLPKSIHGVPGSSKTIKPGDLIVMGGGRIGKDGIHGATFSSEELHKDSPVQAVQIGDPITQKKLGDFIMEARDRGLYRFITDNGAGGLSSSVGEMAEECNGCCMDLAKAPLKYAGMQPWEILVSEAQERMSFAVPKENIEEFQRLAAERDVEVSVLGEFTDSGKFHMLYNGKTVALIDLEFMHSGLPKMHLNATWKTPEFAEPALDKQDLAADTVKMMGQLNICSDEYKARQYDHEVKGLSVLKPFGGKNRDVAADATVTMVEPLSKEGIILASAILPRYSDIDTYDMAASCIDLAVRRVIAVGGNLKMIAGLDNFCWPDPVQSEKTPDGEYKLAQLVRANRAIYDYTKKYLVPCISGKDSMKNDSTRGGRKISIPPSLLFSVISRLDDVTRAVSFDTKQAGDTVYVIGMTKPELGGSEYFNMLGFTGNNVPKVDADYSIDICNRVSAATKAELVNSLITPALGGIGIALVKSAMAGRLGMDINLDKIPCENCSALEAWFSESNSRFIATVPEKNRAAFEALFDGVPCAAIGTVTADKYLKVTGRGAGCTLELDTLLSNYKKTLDRV